MHYQKLSVIIDCILFSMSYFVMLQMQSVLNFFFAQKIKWKWFCQLVTRDLAGALQNDTGSVPICALTIIFKKQNNKESH